MNAGNVRSPKPTEVVTPLGSGRKVEASSHVLASWLRRYIHGESFRDLSRDLPISHERVRQLLYQQYGGRVRGYRTNYRAMLARVEDDRVRAAAPPCQVCDEPNMRAGRGDTRTTRTCSPACSQLWRSLRYHLDEESNERHRLAIARTYLNNPEKYQGPQLNWAIRYLADPENTPPNRRFVQRNSIPQKVLYS